MSATWLPILLALGAAAAYGTSSNVTKRGLRFIEPQHGIVLILGTTVALFALTAPVWMHASDWFTFGFWIFAANGLMHPLISFYCSMEALKRAPATVATTLSATAPLFAAATSVTLLGESLTPLVAAGSLLTIGGVLIVSWGPLGLTQLMRTALLFATAAAVVRGLNHTVAKWGFEHLESPFMAAFVSFSVSFIGHAIIYRVRNDGFQALAETPRAGLGYFCGVAVLMAFGIACMYGALQSGEVVVVSPLIATYPLFTLVTSLALGDERFTARLGLGLASVLGGVVLIGLDQ